MDLRRRPVKAGNHYLQYQYHLNDCIACNIEKYKGTTCGKAGPTWSGGTIHGNKVAVDGPGDQLWWKTTCGVTILNGHCTKIDQRVQWDAMDTIGFVCTLK